MSFTQGFCQYYSVASKEGQRDFQTPNKTTFGNLEKEGQTDFIFIIPCLKQGEKKTQHYLGTHLLTALHSGEGSSLTEFLQ